MKQIRFLSVILCLLASPALNAGDKPAGEGKAAGTFALAVVSPNPAEVELVKGLVVTGALTKVIGNFNTFGRPSAGNTFEFDLTHPPKERITFTRTPADPSAHAGPHPAYMPFPVPLVIEGVLQRPGHKHERAVINLAARQDDRKFLIQVLAESLEKGSKVRVLFYQDTGFIGSMAEAEGVLK